MWTNSEETPKNRPFIVLSDDGSVPEILMWGGEFYFTSGGDEVDVAADQWWCEVPAAMLPKVLWWFVDFVT